MILKRLLSRLHPRSEPIEPSKPVVPPKPTRPVYLVRVRDIHRIRESYSPERVDRSPLTAIFATREEAVRFTERHIPIDMSPFACDHERLNEYEGRLHLDEGRYDGAPTTLHRCLSWSDIEAAVDEASLHLPDDPDEQDWADRTWERWWNEAAQERTPEQMEVLRVRIGLPGWAANPFSRLVTYQHSNGLSIDYSVSRAELLACIAGLGLNPPTQVEGRAWIAWWDATAPQMTDQQKATLWRLMDPEPYEIVEVELEETT